MRRLNFDLVESADTRPSTVYASCLDPCSRLTEAPIFSQTIKQIIVNGRVSADSTRSKFKRRNPVGGCWADCGSVFEVAVSLRYCCARPQA